MKRSIYLLMALLAAAGCHSGHDHEGHDHEGHDHELEAHDEHTHEHDHEQEDHEGHNHEHEGHDHESEGHGHEGHDHEHESAHNPLEISFDEARQELFGVRSETVEARPFSQIIHVGGSVLPAVGDESFAIAPVSGIVTFSGKSLVEGTTVSGGSVIAGISTRDVAGGDVVAKLRATYEAAKKEYERDAAMVDEKIVSISHFEQSRLAYEQARAEYEAVTSSGQAGEHVSVKSPLGGYVKTVYVTSGQFVEAGSAIAAISQNRTLQLRADVPDRYASSLHTITDANFTTTSGETFSVKELGGRVSAYGRSSESGYIPVTFEFSNRASVVAGTYVDVYLKGASAAPVIALPNSALVEEQGTYCVYVRLDEDCFMKREVRIGGTDGVSTVILSGIEEGEDVVVSGAMQIKLSSASAIPSGHNHSH